jgi:hypothetical protein
MDQQRSYVEQARDRMEERGYYLQAVVESGPFTEPYVYTAGLQRLPDPHPEVITFACCLDCGAGAVREAFERVAAGVVLRPGEVVPLGGSPVRVEAVLPEWVDAYGCLADDILEQEEVPMVQLVLPDERGRWPDEQEADPSPLAHQPLLSRDPAWLLPISHDEEGGDLFVDALPARGIRGGDELGAELLDRGTIASRLLRTLLLGAPGSFGAPLLAVPVLRPGGREGRFELVPVEPLGRDRARIVGVPWAADHVAVGDEVEVRPLDGLPGCGAAVGQMGTLLIGGARATRAYDLQAPEHRDPDGTGAAGEVLWDWHGRAGTSLSTTWATLHVNTEDPDGFDAAVRPLVRDGLLRPRPLRSVGESLPLELACCPHCG